MCGICLSKVPADYKIRFKTLPLFQVLFAQRESEIGTSGNYQGFGSKSKAPEFWVDANIIARYLPDGINFLRELFPYYCIAEFPFLALDWLCQDGGDPEKRVFKYLCKYGAPLEAMLFKRELSELVRPLHFKGDYANLTDADKKLADELLQVIKAQYL